MKVVLISGKAGSGKDTTASIMKENLEKRGYNVLVTHYADLLKYVCKTYFLWNGIKDAEGRQLLQYVGTDLVRNDNPDMWVSFVTSMLKYSKDIWDYVIIPDCRFPNEIDFVKNNGFDVVTVRIEREEFDSALSKEQLNHPSETALDRYDFDVIIHNDATLARLKRVINYIIKEKYI